MGSGHRGSEPGEELPLPPQRGRGTRAGRPVLPLPGATRRHTVLCRGRLVWLNPCLIPRGTQRTGHAGCRDELMSKSCHH